MICLWSWLQNPRHENAFRKQQQNLDKGISLPVSFRTSPATTLRLRALLAPAVLGLFIFTNGSRVLKFPRPNGKKMPRIQKFLQFCDIYTWTCSYGQVQGILLFFSVFAMLNFSPMRIVNPDPRALLACLSSKLFFLPWLLRMHGNISKKISRKFQKMPGNQYGLELENAGNFWESVSIRTRNSPQFTSGKPWKHSKMRI